MPAPVVPLGGTTGLDHESSAALDAAAEWLLSMPDTRGRAIIPEMRTRFGISTLEAVHALHEANRRRAAT